MVIEGISVSDGISIGTARVYRTNLDDIPYYTLNADSLPNELDRFHTALHEVGLIFLHMQQKIARELGAKHGEIYESYQLILEDPFFTEEIPQAIMDDRLNAETLVKSKLKFYEKQFETIDDAYLKERMFDIKGVSRRLIYHLLQHDSDQDLTDQKNYEAVIIIAKELTPADSVHFHHRSLKGIVTEYGGETSHAAILARSMEVPAMVGAKNVSTIIKNGDRIIIDAVNAEVFVNPDKKTLQKYQRKQAAFLKKKKKIIQNLKKKIVNFPQRDIKLLANLNDISEIDMAKKYLVDGVGLYRTEYNFIAKEDFIGEEEQFIIYKTLVESFNGQPVTIRILDLGGDKFLPLAQFAREPNPFLGWRSIRILLDQTDIFKSHLRAILRASAFGDVKIMVPMVSSLEDILKVKNVIASVEADLVKDKLIKSKHIPFGIMIEIPSAAILIDSLMEEVDFVSIGTNDLIQYTLATDRTNEKVAKYYQPFNPAVLKLIDTVGAAGKKYGKDVSVCGEMAGDPLFTQMFLSMGINQLSMHPSATPLVKTILLHSDEKAIDEVSQKICSFTQINQIHDYLLQQMEKYL